MFLFDVKIIILTAAILAAVYFFAYCYKAASWTKTAVKTMSVLLLGAAGFIGGAEGLLIAGLVLSALGDFLLSRDQEPMFLAGVGAFAMAHVTYVILFLTTPGAGMHHLSSTDWWVILGLLAYGTVMMLALYKNAGDLRFAVCLYVPIILAMGVSALMMPGGYLGVTVAAFLFMLSDSVLASEMFLLRENHPLRRVTPFVIWSTYWLAQVGFLLAYPVGL